MMLVAYASMPTMPTRPLRDNDASGPSSTRRERMRLSWRSPGECPRRGPRDHVPAASEDRLHLGQAPFAQVRLERLPLNDIEWRPAMLPIARAPDGQDRGRASRPFSC